MTFPVQFHLLSLNISAHQVLELLAYAAGFQLYLHLRRRWPRQPSMTVEQTAWIVVAAIFGALIGSKTLAWAESFPWYWQHCNDWRILIGGKTIVGALLGGWVAVELAKRRLGLSHPSGDIYVFPAILGMCIGRLGCFLAGLDDHTYGIASSLPWAVDFGDGIRRHPTQLYEIAFLLLLAAAFAWRIKSARQHGCMFSQFMFAYLAFRFAIEFIKPRYTLPILPLSAIQLAAAAGIAYALLHWNDHCCGQATFPLPVGGPLALARAFFSLPRATSFPASRRPAGPSPNLPSPSTPGQGECSTPPPSPTFLELTTSLCPSCLRKVEAKVLIDASHVFLQKFCPDHGLQRVLIADDAAYWRHARDLYKPPTSPLRRNTPMHRGCPFDCGLCPDHEQHSCLAIVEITHQCDLACPICYAASTTTTPHRSLPEIESMLDAIVANETSGAGHPSTDEEFPSARRAGPSPARQLNVDAPLVNVVQISGGEPTLHPDLFAILDAARSRPIRHLMLNTNGRRLATDPEFTRRLASYLPGFEVYLQFDSLRPSTLQQLRGIDLRDTRLRALDALNRHNISTTLVVTLKKGLNDREIGEILDFAIAQPCVRGVTFQPIQAAGRLNNFDPALHRLTLTEVRRQILQQHNLFGPHDLLPVPCHTDALAMAYALRVAGKMIPLSKLLDPQALLNVGGNTICYEQDPNLRHQIQQLFSASASPSSAAQTLNSLCCLPLLPKGVSSITYTNVFRVIIMQFMDAWNMDLRSLKRSCVHIAHPDGRLIPFETYNLLYRHAELANCSSDSLARYSGRGSG